MSLKLILIVSILQTIVDAVRILVVIAEPSYSHQVAFRPILAELARRGHQLTVFTPAPINDSTLQNYHEVKLSYSSYKAIQTRDVLSLAKFEIGSLFYDFYERNEEMTNSALSHPVMQQLISPNSTEKFDAIIIEYLFLEALLALSYRFNASLIGIVSLPTTAIQHYLFGNPISWAYLPDICANLNHNMTLWDRLLNMYYNIYQIFWYQYTLLPVQEKMVRKHFGDSVPPAHELVSNMDLLLSNFHPFLYPHAHVPGIIPIRGSRPINQKDLPEDLKKILDNAKNGFIYFSLGTNLNCILLSTERLDMFRKTFEKLPYTVVWKCEADIPNKSDNVITRKWLPQSAVLAHPNALVFIYQGGLQSTEEAIENGVPVIGLPVFGDQYYNVQQMETYGVGKRFFITDVNEDELSEAIIEVITNSSYKNNILKLRDLLHDLPYEPLNNAVWWIEHVIRHKGGRHLRSKSRDMPWYKVQLFDIKAIVFVSVVFVMYIIVMIIRFILWIVKFKLVRIRPASSVKKQQ